MSNRTLDRKYPETYTKSPCILSNCFRIEDFWSQMAEEPWIPARLDRKVKSGEMSIEAEKVTAFISFK